MSLHAGKYGVSYANPLLHCLGLITAPVVFKLSIKLEASQDVALEVGKNVQSTINLSFLSSFYFPKDG